MNKVSKKAAKVCMSKGSFVKEHRKLIPILRKGSKESQHEEAEEQERELKNKKH